MTYRRLTMTAFLLVAASITIGAQPDPAVADTKRILDLLRNGKSEAVFAEFNETMAAALPLNKLQALWATVEQQAGAFGKVIDERVAKPEAGITAVSLGCQFEKAVANFVVIFDANKKIAGLSIRPRPQQ